MVLKSKLNFEKYEENFEYLKLTMTTGKIVNFLDLNVSFNNISKKLDYSVYTKPTNNFSYLRIKSDHPRHIFNNIPKALFIRNRRICSDYFNYIIICKTQMKQLIKRGYNRISLIKLCKTIGKVERDSLLPYKVKKNFLKSRDKKTILYYHKYNYNLKVNNIINNSFNNTSLLSNYDFLYINKVNCNLNNALVHNFNIKKQVKYKTKKCLQKDCIICKFIYEKNYIHIKDYNIKINIKNNATCQTSNIIYIIMCTKCNIFYIGETDKTLNERIRQHINHIINFKPYLKYYNKEVPKHFRKKYPLHSFKDFKVCVFKSNFINSKIRKQEELDLVNFLNTNKKRCINKKLSTKTKILIFKT
jgi:hypothetical protein